MNTFKYGSSTHYTVQEKRRHNDILYSISSKDKRSETYQVIDLLESIICLGKMFVVFDLENKKTTSVTQVNASPKLGLASNFLPYNSERGRQWRGAKLALDRK